MTDSQPDFRDFTTTADPDAEDIRIGSYLIPSQINGKLVPRDVNKPICYFKFVAENGRFICAELRMFRHPRGGGVTSSDCRIPIAKYIRQAVENHGRLQIPAGSGGPYWFVEKDGTRHLAQLDSDNALIAGGATHTREYKRANPRRTNKPVPDDTLREVAKIYQQAIGRGEPPAKAVYETIPYISRTTAGRWIGYARKRGHLGPARPRTAGEY